MNPVIAVFGASKTQPYEPDFADAEALGALLAEAGMSVATGGYGGLMEAVSKGAASRSGHVIGVTAPFLFPGRSGANSSVSEERPHESLTMRIDDLITSANAVIALPGSLGTLTELVTMWNSNAIAGLSNAIPKPLVTVGSLWETLISHLAHELDADVSSVHHVHSAVEAGQYVIDSLTS